MYSFHPPTLQHPDLRVQSTPPDGDGPDCLIIEDSDFDQALMNRVLTRCVPDIRVRFANTLELARSELSVASPDLILLDNGLPDGSGINFALELRENAEWAHIPIIMISDWPSPFMFDKAMIARVRYVLRKGDFGPDHVLSALKRSA